MYGKNQNSGISELRQELRKSSQYKNFRPYLIIAIGGTVKLEMKESPETQKT